MKRRSFLGAGAAFGLTAATGGLLASFSLAAKAESTEAKLALTNSNLVYLSPVKSNGKLSSCQAEVWYTMVGPDVYVCTATSSWRSQAPRAGLATTKLWVGDLGVWTRVDYQSLPSIMATGSVVDDSATIERALTQFGQKYSAEWGTWGPRFKNGLADGSRTLLRYQLS